MIWNRMWVLPFGLACLAVLFIAPFIGMETIPVNAVLTGRLEGIAADIFWKIRIPRVLAAFLAGAALATSGMAFQALFRNPLATPFTLGVSSGAAFGAAIYVKFGFLVPLLGMAGQTISAFFGALLAIIFVYSLTKIKRGFSTATMLLAGVAASFFFSSLLLFIQYLSDFTHSFRIVRWLMGGVEIFGYEPVLTLSLFVVVGVMIVFYLINELNLLLMGEDIAISRGVDVNLMKALLFFGTSLMVGGVVSLCGPIGFVGIMTPHICRLLVGSNHRVLAPLVFLFGGVFLVICDILSRTLIAPAEIPVGVITALLGGPFFIWLLITGKSEQGMI